MFCCFLCCFKQKYSKICMNFQSLLLFLSGALTIYTSICMFLQLQVFGGFFSNLQSDSNGGTNDDESKPYFNSYIHMFIFISGISAMIMGLSGCCTSNVPDRCCVCSFSLLSIATFVLFSVSAIILVALNLKSQDFVQTYCQQDSIVGLQQSTDQSRWDTMVNDVARNAESLFFDATKSTFGEVDKVMIDGIQKYMCKAQCPCDPRGIKNLALWGEKTATKLANTEVYDFTGKYTNYYDCYQDLVTKGTIDSAHIINKKTLVIIQDFEENMTCAGMCQVPDFWFYQDFFNGPPTSNCLNSMKEQFDRLDGFLGYSFAMMAICTLFQIFSICGLCRSTDRCFQSQRDYSDVPADSEGIIPQDNEKGIEMESRASKYMIKQRNYEVDN